MSVIDDDVLKTHDTEVMLYESHLKDYERKPFSTWAGGLRTSTRRQTRIGAEAAQGYGAPDPVGRDETGKRDKKEQ